MTKGFILCVDDDPDDCSLLGEAILKSAPGLKIHYENDAFKALDFLQHAKEESALPSLIIMDLNMPSLDGKEAVVRLKEDPQLQSIPVVIMTTNVRDPDLIAIEKKGATIMKKPDSISGYGDIAKTIAESML